MRKNYEINFTTKTITITKAFSEKAQDFGSEEFKLYKQFQSELPEFSIVTPAPKARKKNSKITYDKMVKYITCQMDSTVLLKRFAEVRELSKATSAPYNFVYRWFITTFPTYDELPEFDEKGDIIPMYDLAAAGITYEEESKSAA
ncbi:hypothetical protein ACPW7J_03675 [Ihubacter sp. rT4E-8]|uniref:hypothetical protein n=1 Tax=Ihubacter sp. rT4E-8 TaxID=3242369 RepID=UPI003CE95732